MTVTPAHKKVLRLIKVKYVNPVRTGIGYVDAMSAIGDDGGRRFKNISRLRIFFGTCDDGERALGYRVLWFHILGAGDAANKS